jgi:hypothetical protein
MQEFVHITDATLHHHPVIKATEVHWQFPIVIVSRLLLFEKSVHFV